MILIKQNFGSNPKISCRIRTEAVITTGFLYLKKFFFIESATSGTGAATGILFCQFT